MRLAPIAVLLGAAAPLAATVAVLDPATFPPPRSHYVESNTHSVGSYTSPSGQGAKPAPILARWRPLIGEYGDGTDSVLVLEKDGVLHGLVRWTDDYALAERSPNVFTFPKGTPYEGRRLVFVRTRGGGVERAEVGSFPYARRQVGPAPGETQLRIKPVRPVDELRQEALAATPPKDSATDGPPLVELTSLDRTIKLEVRYATSNNFLGTPVYLQARAFMRRPAAEALVRVHHALWAKGYGLLIHDAYRPWYVTKIFWDATPPDKHWLVADPAEGSKHNRGAAVDLTLYDRRTGKPVEMPSTYDESTHRAFADYPGGTSLQRWHRALLRAAMEAEGFAQNPREWWHYDFGDWRSYPIMNVRFEDLGKTAEMR